MSPIVAALLQGLVMYGPAWYAAAVELFHKSDPTKEDFLALLKLAQQKTYDDYIADARSRIVPPAPTA